MPRSGHGRECFTVGNGVCAVSAWHLYANFQSPLIFLEQMKLHSLNWASGSTTVSPTTGVKNSPERAKITCPLKPSSIFLERMKLHSFRFVKWIDYGKSHRRDEIFLLKGAWSGSRDPFKDFKLPSIFLEWMKH